MQFFSKPKEELEHVRIQFKATQNLSLQIQDDLERLIAQYNAGKCKMVSGFTYETCLEEMKSTFKTNLTDEVLEKLVSQNPSKPTILSVIKSLEVQHESLMQLQVNLNLIRRQMDNPWSYYFATILSLTITIHAVVLPLIFGDVIFTSYHLARSVAFAVCWIPKLSYIFCSSVLTLLFAMDTCLAKVSFTILTILRSTGTDHRFVNSLRMLPTWYFNAYTLAVPNSS